MVDRADRGTGYSQSLSSVHTEPDAQEVLPVLQYSSQRFFWGELTRYIPSYTATLSPNWRLGAGSNQETAEDTEEYKLFHVWRSLQQGSSVRGRPYRMVVKQIVRSNDG